MTAHVDSAGNALPFLCFSPSRFTEAADKLRCIIDCANFFSSFLSDGLRNVPGEDCDDGNNIATDGCHNCKVSVFL